METFSKAIVSGGSGITYAANAVWIIGRQTEKEGKEVSGYNFIINIDKSRFVKEKSKIPISVTHKGGISKYSGLQDLAIEAKLIVQSGAWYQVVDPETGEINPAKIRATAINTPEVMLPIIKSKIFRDYVEQKYKLSNFTPSADEDEIADYDEVDSDPIMHEDAE
jgi:hypothetical protein